ncbi:MAG: AMIN domain-containing protein [Gemmatimonadetes bacterium]|nr:AMIN domain-containing protein [Gemmatimonadota bacterium]
MAAVDSQAQTATTRIGGLQLLPSDGATELTIMSEGASITRWNDFTLDSPSRVVVDIPGSRNALTRSRYDGIGRGGVGSVRASQFSPDVVRIVIDLDRAVSYNVEPSAEGLRVRFSTGATAFSPWSTSGTGARPTPAASTNGGDPGVRLPPPQPRITVTFQNADIRDVLSTIAEFTGRSIVPGSGVTGNVTATIRDQPWDVALHTILRAYGLAAQEMPSGIIQVDAIELMQSRMAQEPLLTETFRINYVPVAELALSLDAMRSERGRISTNASTNTLIVTDVESVVDNVRRMLGQLDVRTPQVSIQAKIIFVNRTDVEELGITYDLKDRSGSSLNRLVSAEDPFNPGRMTDQNLISLGGNSIAALGNANVRVQGPQLETVISLVLGRFTLVTFIDALQSAELSDVQAAPTITTMDNQEAEIWVGERTPIRVVDVGQGGGGEGGAARATAELVETGIRLRVTPHITADRRILMQLHAERSSAQLAATDIGVVFQQQQGTTRLMVEDGETAVIGGLTVTEVGRTRAGIPFLMDLPVVGRFFRTERMREQKRDLLIMVTPHIVDDRR